MPRTRRASAPEADANEQATLGLTEATPEMPNATAPTPTPEPNTDATMAEGAAPESTEKPARPRRRRTTKATAEAAEAAPAETVPAPAEAIAPPVEPEETEKPKRRPRARRKTAEPVEAQAEVVEAAAEEQAPEPILEAVADTEEPAEGEETATTTSSRSRRRRRGRREPAAPAAPVASAEPAAIEGVERVENISEENGEGRPGSRRSRRRGRQAPASISTEDAIAIAGLGDLATPVTATDETEMADLPSPVRRGRSRRRKPTGEDVDLAVAGAEVVTPTTEEGAVETEEGGRRGRRSRRGGRRRRGDDVVDITESSSLIVGGEVDEEAEIEEEEIEEEVLLPYPPPAPPVYVAPPLVRPVQRASDARIPATTASIVRIPQSGHARVAVNDNSFSPCFFFINAETATDGEVVESQIRHAAAQGVHLYSSVMYLPLKNAYGERTFGPIDSVVQQVLAADPDGYIMPRLQFVPTNYWVRTHHDQLARYSDGSEGDVSLASTDFWSDCVDALEALIAHFADPNTPGGDRVIGFHLDRGEWFYDSSSGYDLSGPNRAAFQNWLHTKYQFVYELRAAWYDGGVTFENAEIPTWQGSSPSGKKGDTPLYATRREGRWVDYASFSSDLVAEVITGIASAIKTLSENRLLVAVSYGYTLEFSSRNDSGHLAMAKVLASDDIDIVAGPNAYTGRGAGSAGSFSLLVDSIKLHNKLWLMEDDTKTHLADTETPDNYNPRIPSPTDTAAVHQRHFAASFTHKGGIAWMDLWGQGWLNDENLWNSLGGLRRVGERWSEVCDRATSHHDIIAIVDEASLCYLKNDPAGLGANLIGKTRELLLRTGASVGFYLQSDIVRDDFPDAPLYLFLNAFRITTQERQAVRDKLQRQGKTLAWLYAPGLFDEEGPAKQEIGEIVGMSLRLQPWNAKVGSQLVDIRHPLTERVRSGKRVGQEEILNPSFAVSDPQATILGEYISTGAPSIAVREHPAGWKSVFFGDPHITVELLRGLFAYAGVPLYDSQDDIVLASRDGSLLLHAPYTGQRTVHLPEKSTVYDVAEDKIVVVDSRSFRTFLRARTSRLFLFGSSSIIAQATGLEIPVAPPPQQRPAPAPEPRRVAVEDEDAIDESVDIVEDPTIPELPRLIPGLDTIEAADIGDGEEGAPESLEEITSPQPRSRWQRRRAAARARREAERKAKAATNPDGTPASVDIAALLPDLPPRLSRPEGYSENGTPESE
jgi:hypothetical protein